jgi:tetratricopeptide (TPR) repeat protein
MNNDKRLWTIVLAVVLGSVLLVACGGGAADAPISATPRPAPAVSPTPSASEHMELGLDYHEQGQLEEAAAEFEEAVRLDPDFVEAHYNLGLTYADQGQFDAAIAEYEEAIRLAPDLAEAHNGLGNVYSDLGRTDEALAAYQETVRLDPSFADAHFNLGHVYMSMEQYAQALAAYQEADRLSPGDAETLHNIGVAYIKQGMVSEASSAWEDAVRANPEFAETHYTLGLAYIDLRRYGEAVTELNEALRLDPERSRAYKHLGVAYYALGEDAECIAAFETYLSLHPDDPDRETMEATIAELEGAADVTGVEYRNAEGGYSLIYPHNLYYDEDGAWAVFAGSQAAIQAVFDDAMDDALGEAPVAMFDVMPLAELAEDLELEEIDDPAEFLQAMADDLDAETSEPGTGTIGGFPGAVAEISGSHGETPYRGALAIILVEERVFGGFAMALSDQWDAFYPVFADMLTNVSFFKP